MLRTIAIAATEMAVGRAQQATTCLAHRPGRSMTMLAPSSMRLRQEQDIRDLNDFLPTLVEELKEESAICKIPAETEWLGKLLLHCVPGGKMVRALGTYNAMKVLAGPDNLTPEYLHKAKAVSWSVEMLQSAFTVGDDIADESDQRRGKPTWHTIAGVGAVFDVLLIEQSSFRVLRRYLSGDPYVRVIQLYLDTIFQGCFGQNHDIHCTAAGRALFDDFNHERYKALCEFKSGEYTFYLPTATALYAHGLNEPVTHKRALELASDIGLLYQVQDDYLDCYGIIDKMGKGRTDIRNGKCTWLIAEAKQRANDTQLRRLKENYGYDDQEKVSRVEEIYNELNMKEVFLQYERDTIAMVEGKIKRFAKELPPLLYTYVMESIKYHINR